MLLSIPDACSVQVSNEKMCFFICKKMQLGFIKKKIVVNIIPIYIYVYIFKKKKTSFMIKYPWILAITAFIIFIAHSISLIPTVVTGWFRENIFGHH